jgi:hypothetical protein
MISYLCSYNEEKEETKIVHSLTYELQCFLSKHEIQRFLSLIARVKLTINDIYSSKLHIEILMKNHTCVWRNIYNTARAAHSRYSKYFAKHACDFLLIPLD